MTTVAKDIVTSAWALLVPLFAALAICGHLMAGVLAERIEQHARDSAIAVRHQVEAAADASFTRMLQTVADSNLAQLARFHHRAQTGALSLEEAKRLALEFLATQTVGRNGYLLSYNSQGVIQGHPDKALINTLVNPGLLDRLQQLKPLEEGEYPGHLPGNPRQEQSLTLFKAVFAPWDWTIALICSASDRQQTLPLAALAQSMAEQRFAGGLRPFLLDRDGRFLPAAVLDRPGMTVDRGNLELLAATLRQQADGTLSDPLPLAAGTEADTLFIVQRPAGSDLIVGVHGLRSVLFQPLTSFRLWFALGLAALFLAALAVAAWLGSRHNRPLAGLARQMALADQQTGEVGIDPNHRELSLMATAFNRQLAESRRLASQLAAARGETQQLELQLGRESITQKEIRQKLQTEIATRTSAEQYLLLFKGIFDNAIEGIYITDPQARILTVNHSFSRITGYQPSEVIGRPPSVLSSGRQDSRFYRRMWRDLREKGFWSGEIWNQNKDGTVCPQWLSISVIKNDRQETTHYFAFFHDISELKRKEKQISIMAYSDALTRLPNRTALEFRLTKAIARATRDRQTLAVFFIDLDNFKNVNDSLGHDTGDRVLVEVANRLSQTIRSEDTLSRLGGDEFILLSEHIDNENSVYVLANRILAALQQPIELPPHTIYINASVGVAVFPDDGRTAQELIKNADMAMYKAKSEGKNTFVMFTKEMNDKLLNRIRIENSIRTGLKNREFSVFYQPKIELAGEQPTSFEALIRWRKNGTIIGPDHFIPIAEESGLIDEMSLYVLDEVCLFFGQMLAHNLPLLPVSVNISPRTFNNLQIVETIDTILAGHRIDHHLLEFEITETTAMKDVRHTLATMQRFRQRGIRFSIDDFGTGYSSLSYLSEMPVSTLKIDKRFIGADDANSRSIVSTITAMSKQMRLKVVAEGVETDDQLRWLRHIGCDEVQGFYFSQPMPGPEALLYLQAEIAAAGQAAMPASPSIH